MMKIRFIDNSDRTPKFLVLTSLEKGYISTGTPKGEQLTRVRDATSDEIKRALELVEHMGIGRFSLEPRYEEDVFHRLEFDDTVCDRISDEKTGLVIRTMKNRNWGCSILSGGVTFFDTRRNISSESRIGASLYDAIIKAAWNALNEEEPF